MFLCFNRNLALHLSRQEFACHPNLTVKTVYGLLYNLVSKVYPDKSRTGITLKKLPELAEEAATTALETGDLQTYDVLIIDEAQDVLSPQIMNALDLFLVNGMAEGRWVLYLDTSIQTLIYNNLEKSMYARLSSRAAYLMLTVNMRNPAAIAREAAIFSQSDTPVCRRQLVSPVDYITVHDKKTTHKKSISLIKQLIAEGVESNDIVLLSFRSPTDAFFNEEYSSIGKHIHILEGQKDQIESDHILASSISAFKGLESEIVIIGDLPDNGMNDWQRASLYVALTRARTAVYIICSQDQLDYRLQLVKE